MRNARRTILATVLLSVFSIFGSGCASTWSKDAKPFRGATGEVPDFRKFDTVTVVPFTAAPGKTNELAAGDRLATEIAARIKLDFRGAFSDVRLDKPLGQPNELVIKGHVENYTPGSRLARSILIGLGSTSFAGNVTFEDGKTGAILLTASFDKLWAWGGLLGASRGITEIFNETAGIVAATAAHGKGWKPTPSTK